MLSLHERLILDNGALYFEKKWRSKSTSDKFNFTPSSIITSSLFLSRLAPDIKTLCTPFPPRDLRRFWSVNRNMDCRSSCHLLCSSVSTFQETTVPATEPEHVYLTPELSVSSPVIIPHSHRRRTYMTSCLGIYLWVLAVG